MELLFQTTKTNCLIYSLTVNEKNITRAAGIVDDADVINGQRQQGNVPLKSVYKLRCNSLKMISDQDGFRHKTDNIHENKNLMVTTVEDVIKYQNSSEIQVYVLTAFSAFSSSVSSLSCFFGGLII